MLPSEKIKKHLGEEIKKYTDEELLKARDQMYQLVNIMFDMWMDDIKKGKIKRDDQGNLIFLEDWNNK